MSSHFEAIGFAVREMRDYWALAHQAARAGERIGTAPGRALFKWALGGGPEVWAQLNEAGEPASATPFFASDDTYRIAITGTGAADDDEFEGWVDGWLNPTEEDEPFSGVFPLRVDLVNYPVVRPLLRPGQIMAIRLAMILFEVSLYPDVEAYRAVQTLSYRPPVPSFTSSLHFGIDEPEPEAEATALITGFVEEPREQTNPATGVAFWSLRVATTAVTLPLTAARETLPVEPRAGQVLSGSGWVLGELLPRINSSSTRL